MGDYKYWDAKNPLGYISEQSMDRAAKRSMKSNAMTIHPMFPFHIRFAFFGIVGGGALYYVSSSGHLDELERQWAKAGLPQITFPDTSALKILTLPEFSTFRFPDLPSWLNSWKFDALPGSANRDSTKPQGQ